MNTILLNPTDVLFFRDGRPMEGSLAGHGAAWPLPHITNAALHAALHRGFPVDASELNHGVSTTRHGDHLHRVVRRGKAQEAERHRRFGSLATSGPFPVRQGSAGDSTSVSGDSSDTTAARQTWFFPRPTDLQDATLTPALLPVSSGDSLSSSMPKPLQYAVANRLPPSKEAGAKAWISGKAFQAYLEGHVCDLNEHMVNDQDFCDIEHSIGIAIDPETQTTGQGEAAGKIYSAHYLRLREEWRLGLLAHCGRQEDNKVFEQLLTSNARIMVGGQQRVCTAQSIPVNGRVLPLPRGIRDGFHKSGEKFLVKWILLTPAVWPEIPAESKDGRRMTPHPGGWLPNWVFLDWDAKENEVRENPQNGRVLLTTGPGVAKAKRLNGNSGSDIQARLVAAIVPKPIAVTGWSLGDPFSASADERQSGACSTHLAVPAGAVYYFEADGKGKEEKQANAQKLANALNWHGASNGNEIKNRRSTLMGEKGFGLGVCGTWDFFEKVR